MINQLKDNFNLNTTVVLLSNLMTWYNTPPKKEVSAEEDGQEDAGAETEEKAEDINTILKEVKAEMAELDPARAESIIENIKKTYNVKDVMQVKKQKIQAFNEDDFPLRTPFEGFEELKLFETRCMNLANK